MNDLNLKCSICGKEFTDIDSYVKHVTECAEEHKKKESDLLKLNAELNKVKAAKEYYEDVLANFKRNYPEAYKLNFGFGKDKVCNCHKDESKHVDSSKDNLHDRDKKETIRFVEKDPFVRELLRLFGE